MSMREERKIIITLDPDELRRLADKMERLKDTNDTGSTNFVDFLGYSAELKVCLHYDRLWFETRDKPTKKAK